MMKRKRLTRSGIPTSQSPGRRPWHYVLCLACLPAVAGCASRPPVEGADDPGSESPVPVHVAKAQLTTLRPSVDLVGMLVAMPERTAVIASQIEGRIQAVSVTEGAIVKRGQTLLELDQRPALAQRLRAEAVVGQQQAILDRLNHGYLPQEIEMAKQEAQRTKAELDSLRLRMDATAKLHESHEVSDVEFKKLQSLLRRGEADYAAAEAKLDLYQVGTRPEAIAEAKAGRDVAHAELVRARLALDFCTLSSPLDGIVTQLQARQGMYVVQSDRLATVVDLSQLFVRIRVPSVYLSSVKQGARVEVSILSLGRETVEGRIVRFSGEANPNTGDVQAFALLQNEQGLLRPGLACRVRLWLPPIEQALVVPVSAVADRAGTSVLHVVRNHKAYEIDVRVGGKTRDNLQITEGLSPGDLVITEGGYGLPDGCPVNAKEQ